MPKWRTLSLSGVQISGWPGVEVYENVDDGFVQRTDWNWSPTAHQHYEVAVVPGQGSYWVPASTSPPAWWRYPVPITGDPLGVSRTVNPNGTERRPSGIYFWIPALGDGVTPGSTDNRVKCNSPGEYPPPVIDLTPAPPEADRLAGAHRNLDLLLGAAGGSSFQDSDGLISFVNLSSDFVRGNAEFTTGQALCDMIANFYSTLRPNTFAAMTDGRLQPLAGDPVPTTQWDASVTHYMQYLLQEAGGLTDYSITTETYSETQYIAEFSTSFLSTVFDTITVPSEVVSAVTAFISGVGESLRGSWDERSRNYAVGLLGQCHEAVQENVGDPPIYRYFPKTKYYYLSVSSAQQEFTTPCASAKTITFDFQYENYVSAIAAAALDANSETHQSFTAFLQRAQAVNYTNATNQLDAILSGVASAPPASHNLFDVDLRAYPVAASTGRKRLTPG
ncbi:hypothetical protein [Amycolatopsis magusensis]|uniref:hypothetical protein n=1 Tax=Amycolatopsis magusensis TaxID=882444 RepID=UPI003C2E5D13